MTEFQRSHAALRAAVVLAGKEIRKLSFGRADTDQAGRSTNSTGHWPKNADPGWVRYIAAVDDCHWHRAEDADPGQSG